MSDETQRWQPGPRLAGRVTAAQIQPQSSRRDPRWLAVAILIAAVAIAVSLWIAALVLQANDSDEEPEANDESALSILIPVAAGVSDA